MHACSHKGGAKPRKDTENVKSEMVRPSADCSSLPVLGVQEQNLQGALVGEEALEE